MAQPVVYLETGRGRGVRGITTTARGSDTEVSAFLGIPYAQPPVGRLRFRPPEQLQLWEGVRDASQYGSICPQNVYLMRRNYGYIPNLPSTYNEDCLFLNIWRPNNASASTKLPVMVWIHGGAFVQGCSNIFDGTSLAAHENVVVISINYRVGVFGFLYTGDDPQDYHGNQGFLDQIEALRWIQKYVDNFGGDAENVTLFGVSAGGISISHLQVSPLTRGLFRRSICQSGSAIYPNSVWTKEGGEKYYWKRLHSMGLKEKKSKTVTEFLDDKSTDQFLDAFYDWYIPSVQDGKFFKDQPLESYTEGSFHPVDCITGFCTDEGHTFVFAEIDSVAAASEAVATLVARNFFRGRHPAAIERICKLAVDEYIGNIGNRSPRETVCDMHGDINFIAPSISQAELHSKRARTYVYHFDHRPFFSTQPSWVRSDHANEVPYVFGFAFRKDLPDSWPEQEKELSRRMMNYWANFARTGNPNGSESPVWNQFTVDRPLYLPLTIPECGVDSVTDFIPDRVRLWNKIVPAILKEYETSKAKY